MFFFLAYSVNFETDKNQKTIVLEDECFYDLAHCNESGREKYKDTFVEQLASALKASEG